MLTNLIKRRGRISGFTLIELLVVIAIIGVLASIVLASLNSARRKSRDARRITDIKQVQLALELYFDASVGGTSQYPAGTTTCTATPDTTSVSENNGLQDLAIRGYIPQVPRDPGSSSVCYRYASGVLSGGTARTSYHLAITLEDTGNTAFNGDKDCSSVAPATCISGSTYTGNTGAGTDPIYDVIP